MVPLWVPWDNQEDNDAFFIDVGRVVPGGVSAGVLACGLALASCSADGSIGTGRAVSGRSLFVDEVVFTEASAGTVMADLWKDVWVECGGNRRLRWMKQKNTKLCGNGKTTRKNENKKQAVHSLAPHSPHQRKEKKCAG